MSQRFPVVESETKNVFFCCACCSSEKPPSPITFREFGDLNIDDRLFSDGETAATAVSGIQALAPDAMRLSQPLFIFITLDERCPPEARIAGASCGLAVALSILHFTRRSSCKGHKAATGLIQAMTEMIPNLQVGAVDNVATKLHSSIEQGVVLCFPMSNLQQIVMGENWITDAYRGGEFSETGIAYAAQTLEDAYRWSVS